MRLSQAPNPKDALAVVMLRLAAACTKYRVQSTLKIPASGYKLSPRNHCLSGLHTLQKDVSLKDRSYHVYHWLDDVEDLEGYVTGGYHPIHLGDELSQGRYRIVHKLGFGTYSTGTYSLSI